jgi:putative endonuclease
MRDEKQPCVYLLASGRHGTLYIGVTSNIMQRVYQHRDNVLGGFTSRHAVKRLVWFEMHGDMDAAITREKQIKKWNRDWKIWLIEEGNPDWADLAIGFGFEALSPSPVRPFRHSREGGNP